MRYLLLTGLFGLAACGTSVYNTTTAGGAPAYEFHCGGLLDSKIDCNLAASSMCPNGYNPVYSSIGRLVATCAPPQAPRPRAAAKS
ncbi:MAG: hypothetical protein NVS2B11_13100 [Acetobacteraceae bacterium]